MLKSIRVLAAPNARETNILKANLDKVVGDIQVYIEHDDVRTLPIIMFLVDNQIKLAKRGVLTTDQIIEILRNLK